MGVSSLPVSIADPNTVPTPPCKLMVPLTATKIKAPNIENICTTSVHTTALRPPLRINMNESVKSINIQEFLAYNASVENADQTNNWRDEVNINAGNYK